MWTPRVQNRPRSLRDPLTPFMCKEGVEGCGAGRGKEGRVAQGLRLSLKDPPSGC